MCSTSRHPTVTWVVLTTDRRLRSSRSWDHRTWLAFASLLELLSHCRRRGTVARYPVCDCTLLHCPPVLGGFGLHMPECSCWQGHLGHVKLANHWLCPMKCRRTGPGCRLCQIHSYLRWNLRNSKVECLVRPDSWSPQYDWCRTWRTLCLSCWFLRCSDLLKRRYCTCHWIH